MEQAKVFRGLRIAVSAVCLIVCGLFGVMWVRSYKVMEIAIIRNPTATVRGVLLLLKDGQMVFSFFTPGPAALEFEHVRDDAEASVLGFRWRQTQTELTVAIPYWFPILLSAASASAPWIPWSKRWGLNTLLIATTLVAVLLGLIVYVAP